MVCILLVCSPVKNFIDIRQKYKHVFALGNPPRSIQDWLSGNGLENSKKSCKTLTPRQVIRFPNVM